MRLIGYLLMTIGLCVGTLAATTAYVPRIGQATEGLTLNAVAGIATPESDGVLTLAKWLPEAAHDAAAGIRDERRGRPRIETRFSAGADSATDLAHPGDLGLIVFADEAGFAPLLPKLGDGVTWPADADMAVIVIGLTPAQVDEVLYPKTEEEEDGEGETEDPEESDTASEPAESDEPAESEAEPEPAEPRGIAVTDGVLIPVDVPGWVMAPSLADLSMSDRYTLAASLTLPFAVAEASRPESPDTEPAAEEEAEAPQAEALQEEGEEPAEAEEAASEEESEPTVFLTDSEGRFIVATAVDAGPEDRDLVPLAQAKDVLTPDLQGVLGASGTTRVRVKEFDFARWEHSWVLGVAVAVLLVGVFLVRSATKKMIAESVTQANNSGVSPADALDRIVARLDRAAEGRVCGELLPHLTEVQREDIPVVLDARNMLIGAMGLKGYAEFMDVFSTMERQINRAWSASADDVFEEAIAAVHAARALAPDVMDKVRTLG